MGDIFKIKQGDSELHREFVDRFQRERMTLPRVPNNWAAIAFISNLNEKSSEATRRLKESFREFPATTWNDVYNRYSTKLRIEEDIISRSQKEEKVSSRWAETEKGPVKTGSSVNIILLRVLHEMQAEDKLIPKEHTLFGFDNSSVVTKGEVILTTFAKGVVKDATFQVVDMEMAYNMILGKPWIYEMDVVSSTLHQLSDTIKILQKFNMKLNPEKCAFGVASALKKQDQFEWTEECQQALKNLKTYLSNQPLLAKPKVGERLLIYLAISEVAPRTAIKSQVLADFVADFSQRVQLEVEKELQVFNGSNVGIWTLFTDGSSNVKGASLGIILVPPTSETIRQAIKCHSITNNEAEYKAVIVGLELARELGINQIVIKSDSQLVVNQMLGTYTARKTRMHQYLEKTKMM
ncbi:uncharacterized protein [Nicotiana sylvestris]|uniref:uncharacterized protein n=1 Tax=Nicotiana sylvestris TaxID=4096 RepID=UPI00388C36DF